MPAPQQSSPNQGRPTRLGILRFALPLLLILVLWVGYGLHRLHDFTLGVGTIHEPTHDSLLLAYVMSALGIPATYLTFRIVFTLLERRGVDSLRNALVDVDRRQALIALGMFGTLVPLLIRYAVLMDAPLTDDEGSYRFAAELLASGRVWVPSYEMPVFFDNGFVINNGKLFSQYFLGWPALLSLGVLVRLPGLINPLLSGLTTVLIALIAERRFGASWGRVAAILYLCSPFLEVSAATQMSHTSSTFALALLLFAVDGFVSDNDNKRLTLLIAASASLAFWIRPATALGFGGPLVFSWLLSLPRRLGALKHLALFLLAVAGPAALFLWVNELQTGSPFRTGYHAALLDGAATHYRFASFSASQVDHDKFFYFFVKVDPSEILSKYVTVLMRLWTDSWGFPLGLSLALLTTRQGTKRLVAPFLGLMLAHIPLPDAGIDTFGPVHYTELMIALVLWSTDGLRRLHRLSLRLSAPACAPSLLVALLTCSAVFYAVPRFTTLALLAADIRAPMDAFESAPPGSVIFTRMPFAPPCLGKPGSHFVFFRPNNDPDLRNERLWANHISLDLDRKLLIALKRKGFLLRHDRVSCTSTLVPYGQASANEFPPAIRLLPGDLGEVPRGE